MVKQEASSTTSWPTASASCATATTRTQTAQRYFKLTLRGYNYTGVAAGLGCTENLSIQRVTYARRRLAVFLEEHGVKVVAACYTEGGGQAGLYRCACPTGLYGGVCRGAGSAVRAAAPRGTEAAATRGLENPGASGVDTSYPWIGTVPGRC